MKQLLTLLLLLALADRVNAQKDTVEYKKWLVSGNLGLDVALQTGNLQSTSIGSDLSPVFKSKQLQISPQFQYAYSRVNKNVLQDDIFSKMSIDLFYRKKFYPNFSARYEATTLRAIKTRYSLGPGIAWRVAKTKKVDLVFLNSVFYHKTIFSLNRERSFDRFFYVLSTQGSYKAFEDKLILTHDIQYVPWFRKDRFDQILRCMATAALPLSEQFSVNINVDYSFETIVPPTRNKANLSTAFGIAYSF